MLLTRELYNKFTKEESDCLELGLLFASDFRTFLSFMFFHMNGEYSPGEDGKKQGSNFIFKGFHDRIIDTLIKYATGKNEKKNLMINVPPRSGKCHDINSYVLTPYKGRIKLKDIHIGDFVYSYKDRKLVIKKVLGEEPAYKESYKITTRSGREVIGSYDHPMLTFDGWKEISKMEEASDYIACINSEVEGNAKIDDNELRFISYMIFEGGCSNRGTNFTSTDDIVLEDFKRVCCNLGFEIKRINKIDYRVNANNTGKAKDLIAKYGIDCLAKNKRLPNIFFNLSMRQKLIFLGILIQTDGYINAKGGFGITLASKGLIEDIQALLSMCGLCGSFHYKASKFKDKVFDSWRLEYGMSELEKIIGRVDFGNKKTNILKIKYSSKKASTNVYPAKIQKLIPYRKRKKVIQDGVKEWNSLSEASKGTGIAISNISFSCRSIYHKAGGFKWEFKDDWGKIKGKDDFSIDFNKNVTPEKFEKMIYAYPELEKYRNIDFYWDRVEKIEKVGIKELKHIEVEDTHNYLIDGLVTHNTLMLTYYAAWCYIRNPRSKIIYTSYADNLATGVSMAVKSIVESSLFKRCYPNIKLSSKKNSSDEWYLEGYEGGMYATAMGGRVTGFGCGILGAEDFSGFMGIDDAIKPADAASAIERQRRIDYYTETLVNRVNNPRTPIIIIAQRLHVEDLCGYIESTPSELENYEIIKVPACDEDGNNSIWPEQWSNEYFMKLKEAKPHYFSSQYLQSPTIKGGSVIKSEWFRTYSHLEGIKFKRCFITGDTALKTKEHNDFTVFCVWGVDLYSNLYLLDMIRSKWEAPGLIVAAKNLWERWKMGINTCSCSAFFVEDKSSGISLIQILQNKSGIPVIAFKVHRDKLTRVETCLDFIQSGMVFLPTRDPKLLDEFLFECESFNRQGTAAHDDIVDNLTMSVSMCNNSLGIPCAGQWVTG